MDSQAQKRPHPQPNGTPAPWFLLSPPEPAPGIVHRDRVLAVLNESIATLPVTLIVAPPGYGKTVAAARWAGLHTANTAWLTLTRHDSGSERFVLVGALNALHRLTAQDAQDPAPFVSPTGLDDRALIGRIAEIVASRDGRTTLVIDDAHHASADFAGNIISVLAALTEGKLRFVLCGNLGLISRFSAQIAAQTARVIGAQELAFTAKEIVETLVELAHSDTAQYATELFQATGGWPIAVQMHRLTQLLPPGPDVSSRLLADYIEGTVLAQLPESLMNFILDVSVCTRLSPKLAKSLSGIADAESLLESCMSQGLFLSRHVDVDGTTVYQWHDEFAERCRDILMRTDGDRFREQQTKAAHWLAPVFPTEAVAHALRAEQPQIACDIIRRSWIRVIIDSGATALNQQCLALPQELVAHPEILLVRACCLNQLGDATGAQLLAKRADTTGGGRPDYVAARAFASLFIEDDQAALEQAIDAAQHALELGRVPSASHAYGLFLLGWTELRLRRAPQRAVQLLEAALREAEASRQALLARRASANLFFALSFAGNFAKARALAAEAPDPVDGPDDWLFYDGGIELFASGFMDFWQHRTPEAEHAFRTLSDSGGHDTSYAALARVFLALCAVADGRAARVRAAHSETAAISGQHAHGVPWPVYQAVARGELYAASGDMDRAVAAIELTRTQVNIPIVRALAADVLRRAGRLGEAAQMLASLSAAELAPSYLAAMTHVTAALIAHERGDTARAHRLFERALDAAVPEHVIHPFVSREERLKALLVQHAASGTAHEEFVAARITELSSEPARNLDLGTVLSAREREIYGYLCTTMTATEIGEALFVSVNTIRTHQRAIYRKLGVTTRRDAIRLRL